jgi:hypothetical protein
MREDDVFTSSGSTLSPRAGYPASLHGPLMLATQPATFTEEMHNGV